MSDTIQTFHQGEGDLLTLKNEGEDACWLWNQASGYAIIPAVGDKRQKVAGGSEGGWQKRLDRRWAAWAAGGLQEEREQGFQEEAGGAAGRCRDTPLE